jgi:hypothetical protein
MNWDYVRVKKNKRKIKINKQKGNKQKKLNKKIFQKILYDTFSVFLDVPFRTSDILCSMTSNICHVIFYVLRCLIKENPVQYF